jgi:hypothetical protein
MKIEKLIEKGWIIFSTIYTLITALNASIANNYEGPYKSISIIAFMLGVGLIILQLVISNYFINDINKSSHKIIQELKEIIKRNETLILPKNYISLSNEICALIQTKEVKKIIIICYGTNGFEEIIPKLKKEDGNLSIQTNVLICSPESKYILSEANKDRETIRDLINDNKTDNITFTESPVPPTMRACMLYDAEEEPIWSSIQTYYYNYDIECNSFDYRDSFTIVAKKDGSNILLKEMDEIIEKEFKRLKYFDLKKEGLNDSQIDAIRYTEENGKITIREYCNINNKRDNEAINDLEKLVEKKKLEKKSEKKGKRTIENYVLTT